MYDKLKDILVNDLSVDASLITPEADLKKDLGINSLELPELILRCEDIFDVQIDDDNLSKFITVGDIVKYLESTAK